MADTPTPNSEGSAGKEAAFLKAFARVGIQIDPANEQQIKKALTPIAKYMSDFSKTTDMKNTFFGKLPGIGKMLDNLTPSNVRFVKQMSMMGAVSKAGGDSNQEFYNSLGLVGKSLSNTIGKIYLLSDSMGVLSGAIADVVTFGFGAFLQGLVLVLQGLRNIIGAAIDWQDKLNEFSKMMGGIATNRLLIFNNEVNNNLLSLSKYGFALGDTLASIGGYIKNGLNPAIATNAALTKSTLQLSAVTGESADSLSSFFSGILRGSGLSVKSFQNIGNSFTKFNKSAEMSGKIGTISFETFKEAINSVGTALLIASNKGEKFTEHLTADLAGLAGLAQALNISVSSINSSFEQAGNLITSQESGFRAILAISGGANINDMLNNQFNRTDAMLKLSTKLETLTKQFGGNLNILGQVAEQAFGISKDMAIKLATMTGAQRKALEQAKQDAEYMKSGGLEDSWKNVTATLSSVFDRFRNTLFNMFQRAFSGNSSIQRLLDNIGAKLQGYLMQLSVPGSPINRLVDKLGGFITKLFTGADSFIEHLMPWLDNLINYADRVVNNMQGGGFWHGLWEGIKGFLLVPLFNVFKAGGLIFVDSLMYAWQKIMGSFSLGFFLGGKNMAGVPSLGDTIMGDLEGIFGKLNLATSGNTDEIRKNTKVLELSNKLNQIAKEKSDLASFKDTDLIVNKEGQFTLAGMERNKLDAAQAALDAQQQTADNTADTSKKMDTLISVIQGLNPGVQSVNQLPYNKATPATTPIMISSNKQQQFQVDTFGFTDPSQRYAHR